METNSILAAQKGTFCSGCSACVTICPTKAIQLNMNPAGFYEATVDEAKCIHCGRCQKVCSRFGRTEGVSLYAAKHYAMQSTDAAVVKSSTSGGIAHELSAQAIQEGKTVVGCVYDTVSGRAKHICIKEAEALEEFKGSKYIQSDSSKAFLELVEEAAKNKEAKFVVFGTPCQIAGLARTAILRGIREQLLLIEIFCHGVPSYHLWDKQLEKIKKKLGSAPESVLFRYKKDDWHSYCMKAQIGQKVWYGAREREEFWHVFFENVLLNDACMVCQERLEDSLADLRLGDYWGRRFEEHSDGVSAVFAMTETGKAAVEALVEMGKVQTLEAGDAKEMLAAQNMAGYDMDKKHNAAMEVLRDTGDVSKAVRKYRKLSPKKQKVKRVLLKVSGCLPSGVKESMRKINRKRYK